MICKGGIKVRRKHDVKALTIACLGGKMIISVRSDKKWPTSLLSLHTNKTSKIYLFKHGKIVAQSAILNN